MRTTGAARISSRTDVMDQLRDATTTFRRVIFGLSRAAGSKHLTQQGAASFPLAAPRGQVHPRMLKCAPNPAQLVS
jgi:hypothetical protein